MVFYTSPKCITQLPDSGYFVAGDYYPNDNEQTFTRLDKFGAVVWNKKTALSGEQFSNCVLNTSFNKLVIGGQFTFGYSNVIFMDYNANILSYKRFASNSDITDLAESPDQKVYVLGENRLVKMDSMGNILWQKVFSASGLSLQEIHPISSSKFILTGNAINAQAINSVNDLVQICVDSAGAILWSKAFGSLTNEIPHSSVYSNGKIYQVGNMNNWISGRNGSFIFCTDTIGTQLWCKWVDSTQTNHHAIVLNDGTIADISIKNTKPRISRFSENGDFISGVLLNTTASLQTAAGPAVATNDGGLYLECNSYTNYSRYGMKLSANLYPDCIPAIPYTPDTTFNQVLDEMRLFCTVSNSNPATFNVTTNPIALTFVNVPICNSSCNVIASFTPDQTHLCQGGTTTFTNHSQNATSYQWWLDTTLAGTGAAFSNTFTTPGIYRVKLIASNGLCTDSTFTRILVSGPIPSPVFTYETDHFKGWFNTEVPPYASVNWDFGDGSGPQRHIDSLVHNYKHLGTYTVCLSETGICGTVSSCQDVTLNIDSSFQFIKHYNENSSYNGRRWGRAAHSLFGGQFLFSGYDDTWEGTGWEGTILKTDKKGNPIWTRIISIPTDDDFLVTRMAETHKGYVLFGASNGVSPYMGIMDSSGATISMLRLTTNSVFAQIGLPYEKQNGNIIFSGSYATGSFIAETNLALGVYWFKRHTALRGLGSTVKAPGGFMMVGKDPSNTQIGIMKVDDNGDFVFAKSITHPGSTPTYATDICNTSDGNFVVTGSTDNNLFLMKIDTSGTILWTKKYTRSGSSMSGGRTVTEDASANLTVAAVNGDIVRTDADGNVLWAWNPPNAPYSHSKTLDDGLIVAGTVTGYFDPMQEELSLQRFDNNSSMPTCAGDPVVITATPMTANVSSVSDVVTTGAPPLTRVSSSVLYSSYQAEICATGSPLLNADFTNNDACAGSAVQFNDATLGSVTTRNWSFTDGVPATSSSPNPTVIWNTPGTYSVTLTVTNANGSTSIETQNVTVIAAPFANAGPDLSTCPGTAVAVNGTGSGTLTWNASPSLANPANASTTATPSSTETFVLTAVSGVCASTDTLVVTVYSAFNNTTFADICSGETYSFQGQTLSTPGIHTVPFTTINGCDSIFTLQLTVHSSQNITMNHSLCNGESYSIGGISFSSPGNYTIPLQNQYGCDSTVMLNLTVLPPAYSTLNAQICSGENYVIGPNQFTNPGTHTIIIPSANGCDSTVTLNLTVLPNSSSTTTAEICAGTSYLFNGSTYSTSGTYPVHLQGANGCDSIVTLNLNVLPNSSSTTIAEICAGTSYLFNGSTYSTSGTYPVYLQGANGCDSIATLNLNVYQGFSSTLNETICSGESYSLNGNTYTMPGTYVANMVTVNGCDSLVTLYLNVSTPDVTTNVTDVTLTANASGATYVWINCDDETIVGNSQSYIATENGNYAVVVTQNNCSDTSDCYAITEVGTSQTMIEGWSVFPVPSNDLVYIVNPSGSDGEPFVLYDNAGRIVLSGKLLSEKTTISLSNFSPGIYQLSAGNAKHSFQVVRW